MAVTVYSTTNGAQSNNVSVDAGSGSNRMIVAYLIAGVTEDVTGITWNGESFTRANVLDTSLGRTTRYLSVWYLAPTGTGTQTLTYTGSLFGDMGLWTIVVYEGVSGVRNSTITTSTANTSFSIPITASSVVPSWIGCVGQSTGGDVSAGSNTTIRSITSSIFAADSNGYATPTALAFTSASGTWGAIGVEIAAHITVSVSDANTSLDSITRGIGVSISDTLVSTDSISYPDWINRQKNTTTWTNQTKN